MLVASMGRAATDYALDQHPFVTRLSQHVDLDPPTSKPGAYHRWRIVDPEAADLIVDGDEYRKLCFLNDGFAVRYKLLRNGKRQISM